MDAHDQETQQQENRTTADHRGNDSTNIEDQNAPITAVENQPITAKHRTL